MRLVRSLFLAVVVITLANGAYAAQIPRSLFNTDPTNLYFMTQPTAFSGPNRQMFLNNLDFLNTIFLQVGGQMNLPSDTLTVKLYDGCGTLVTQASQVFDNSGLTTPTSMKYIQITLPAAVPLVYNAYYYLDFKTNLAGQATFVANTDRHLLGKLTAGDVGEVSFPDKKRDVMYILDGTTDSSKAQYPIPTTNIACPSRCVLANPSGVENVSYRPDQQFNILIRERNAANAPKGSFWSDYTAGTIAALKQEIGTMLQGTTADPSLRETYPYNNYSQGIGQPFYYGQMNFYIAIEDPAVDTLSNTGKGYRGFHHCANIDGTIEVVTGNLGYGGAPGLMWGEVNRPAPNTGGWGTGMRRIMVHEVFGHGLPSLFDEYIDTGATTGYQSATTAAAVGYGYMANYLPISSGCNEWCGGTQPVSWLVGQMAADRDAACWSQTSQAACNAPGGSALCRWIGGLAAIPYWGTYKCIPLNAATYSIGTNCSAFGNHGCYPLGPWGSSQGGIMDVVQPNGKIMVSTHQATPVKGFTSHVETHIKDMLDCVFPVANCSAVQSRCANLVARYGTAGNGYQTFLQSAKACDNGTVRRR
jgi:hypothetical protein